tara:strand:- start:296 stop:583 length:288 start_codon:yes stop_codon:yes gene_type:complete
MELQMTQAWRELCELSSGFSELHRGSGTLQQQAGETRGVNGRCLSSSLHNQFITFYRKTPETSNVLAEKDVRKSLGQGMGECRLATAVPEHPLSS